MVNKIDLLNWVSMQMDQLPAGEPLTKGQMRRLLGARHVSDLAAKGSTEAAVRLDETVADALYKMTSHKLADIPVVDADGRIVNDLRLSEILAYMLAMVAGVERHAGHAAPQRDLGGRLDARRASEDAARRDALGHKGRVVGASGEIDTPHRLADSGVVVDE